MFSFILRQRKNYNASDSRGARERERLSPAKAALIRPPVPCKAGRNMANNRPFQIRRFTQYRPIHLGHSSTSKERGTNVIPNAIAFFSIRTHAPLMKVMVWVNGSHKYISSLPRRDKWRPISWSLRRGQMAALKSWMLSWSSSWHRDLGGQP